MQRSDDRQIDITGKTMGTSWRAVWVDQQSAVETVEAAMIKELERVNSLMSTWDADSEISRFNQLREVSPVKLHPDTLHVVDTAMTVSSLTDGRYDITLDPVIRLWGFGPERREAPTPADLRHAMNMKGYQQLVRVADTIRKRRQGISIDLSSLAKGYAVDQLGKVLEAHGVTHYLVEIGGEVRTRGRRLTGDVWRIGVESPHGGAEDGIGVTDAHVASSGSYRNFRIEDGKRISHIIDGKTGEPISHELVAVTVLHESTMLADAWATALLVVGEVQAAQLIEKLGLTAQLTVHENGDFRIIRTASFKNLLLN